MIKNELELANKVLKSDASEDARALAAHYMNLPFALTDLLKALEYTAECTLATISGMASKNKPVYSEFRRQVSIAQKCIYDLRSVAIDYEFEYKNGMRVKEVIQDFNCDVRKWAVEAHLKYATEPNVEKLKHHLYQ